MSKKQKTFWESDSKPIPLGDVFATNIATLTDKQLKSHINSIKKGFLAANHSWHETAPVFASLLMLATAGQNNRSVKCLMWMAITVSFTVLAVSALGVWRAW